MKADLKVTVDGPVEASPDELVTYTMEIANLGAIAARDVTAVFQTDGLDDVLAHPDSARPGAQLVSTAVVVGLRWDLDDLEPGRTAEVAVVGRVAPGAEVVSVLGGASTPTPEKLLLDNLGAVRTAVAPGAGVAGS